MKKLSSEGVIPRRPDILRALGPEDPPDAVEIGGRPCLLDRVLKHDSWAASALYRAGDGRRIVCKFLRMRPLLLLPFSWLGRMMADREKGVFQEMSSLEGFPVWAGPVSVHGSPCRGTVSHYWIEGSTFRPTTPVRDDFFPTLLSMIISFHNRGMAYVDLPKWENILIGEDGRPYLLDYQIRFRPFSGLPLRWLLRSLQRADLFYLRRHWHRSRPDQCEMPDPPFVVRIGEQLGRLWRTVRIMILRAYGQKEDPRLQLP